MEGKRVLPVKINLSKGDVPAFSRKNKGLKNYRAVQVLNSE